MDDHLGYVKGDPEGNGTGNSRNGHYGKTVTTTSGPVRLSIPRDRKSEFEPQIVAKGQRRVGAVDDMILSLYSRGMTTRDIHAHLAEIYGAEVSPALVSAVTGVVSDEITEWQNRPLDAFYAILYIDALVVKVRDGGAVENKAAYLVTGVDVDGFKHVLGIWLGLAEASRFWAGVLAELRNRGIMDARSCAATVSTAFLTRSRRPGRRRRCRQGHSPYPVVDEVRVVEGAQEGRRRDAAHLHRPQRGCRENRPGEPAPRFREEEPGNGRRVGTRLGPVVPFLVFDSAIRKVIYTTNAIQSVNFQLRKITSTAVISPATRRRSSFFTSGSGTSPGATSTATAWFSKEDSGAPAHMAGKQP